MKKVFALSIAFLMGFTFVFSSVKVHAQYDSTNYNELLQQFMERINGSAVPGNAYQPVWVAPGSDSLTGHVTKTAAGEVFLKDENGRTYRLLGVAMARQILQAVVYDKVQVTGTLNKAGTVLGAITGVTPLSGVTSSYVARPALPSPWVMKSYTGWVIKDANGNVFLRLADGRDSSKVMVIGGVPVEFRLLNSTNWRLAFQFIGKGLVRVTGLAHDGKQQLRYNDNGIEAAL